ncbi:MAG: GatB/YqeY domain-containing protein [Peptococcaceae bacterium]|nr:GatB/YqeY domain-containing protein [Peptococcaceae bacterium]
MKNRLANDMKTALRNKDKQRLATIRLVMAAIKNQEIEKGELQDSDIFAIIQKEIKQTKESLEAYQKAGNSEQVQELTKRLAILQEYLPRQMTAEEIKALVLKVMDENNIQSPKEKGKLMGLVMPQVKGRADGKLVNKVVSELLK